MPMANVQMLVIQAGGYRGLAVHARAGVDECPLIRTAFSNPKKALK
jgi:hypothetical protein